MSEGSTYGRERHRKVEHANGATSETWIQRRGNRAELHHKFQFGSCGGSGSGNYDLCAEHACLGEALPDTGRCFAHSDSAGRSHYLSQLPGSNRALCMRGTTITEQLWNEIVSSPMFATNRLQVAMLLGGAEITGPIRMQGTEFAHSLELTGATVFQHIELRDCTFKQHLIARNALFDAAALNCLNCVFEEEVDLSGSSVDRTSFSFQGSTFHRMLKIDAFKGGIHLNGSELHGKVSSTHSDAALIMNGCELHGGLDLSRSELRGFHGEDLVAHAALHTGRFSIGSMCLRRAVFHARVQVEVSADLLDLTGAVLKEGGLLLVEKAAKLHLNQLSLGGPLRIAGRSTGPEQPAILGLLNSDAGQLSLSRVDMSRCSLVGAHGLGNIDIESTVTFARGPFWTGRRRFLADEFAWRSGAGKIEQFGWKLKGVHIGHELPRPTVASRRNPATRSRHIPAT